MRVRAEIPYKGRSVKVPAIKIENKVVLVMGRLLKIATLQGEQWEYYAELDPASLIEDIRKSSMRVDIFTFSQKLPDTIPKYPYYMEWDNMAVIEIANYEHWWKKQIPYSARKSVNKAIRNGVVTKEVPFDDSLVKGIVNLYNEIPIRQKKPFWHYGKDYDQVKKENATYIERSTFIGAYLGNELIGFVKLVYCGMGVAKMMQILSKLQHFDKSPTNALLAKAVELCDIKGMSYLTYGHYTYGSKTKSTLIEFKKHNGFKKVDIPKYYVPLSDWGKIALKLKLHHGVTGVIPEELLYLFLDLRSKWYERFRCLSS